MKEQEKKLNDINQSKVLKQVKKQSTKRATFNITTFANKALEEATNRPGLKHKEIFDIICEDEKLLDVVVALAKEDSSKKSKIKVVQKTLLLSENSLKIFDDVAEKEKIKRGILASYLIFTFEELLKKGEEEEKEGFRKGQEYISNVLSHLEDEKSTLNKEIGDDHPLIQAFQNIIDTCMNLSNSIDEYLSSKKPFDPDSF